MAHDFNKIRSNFICDNCREICKGPCHSLLSKIKGNTATDEEKKEGADLIGRKQIIHCLGPYCDQPCKLQREKYTPYNKEDDIKPFIDLIHFLVEKVNSLLIKEK